MNIDFATLYVGEGLASAGANINHAAQEIADSLNNLMTQWLMPLQDYWQGKARDLYDDYQSEWNAAAAGLFGGEGTEGVLGAIAQAMNVAWGNYTEAEWANIQTWQHS